jgi:hypothetical protein
MLLHPITERHIERIVHNLFINGRLIEAMAFAEFAIILRRLRQFVHRIAAYPLARLQFERMYMFLQRIPFYEVEHFNDDDSDDELLPDLVYANDNNH